MFYTQILATIITTPTAIVIFYRGSVRTGFWGMTLNSTFLHEVGNARNEGHQFSGYIPERQRYIQVLPRRYSQPGWGQWINSGQSQRTAREQHRDENH